MCIRDSLCPVHEMNRMLTADVCAATSQLVVDRPFVLRHLARGHDVSVLEKTLKADEARRANVQLAKTLDARVRADRALDPKDSEDAATRDAGFARYKVIEAKLNPGATGAIAVKLSQKDLKKLNKEKRDVMDAHPGGPHAFLEAFHKAGEHERRVAEIDKNATQLRDDLSLIHI